LIYNIPNAEPATPASTGNIQIALLCNPASNNAVESIGNSSPPTLTGHGKKSKSLIGSSLISPTISTTPVKGSMVTIANGGPANPDSEPNCFQNDLVKLESCI